MDYQRGQILLIVVLVMVTVLTIGLSVAARTVTNIRTSQEAENSEKAFSAAEAGIEQSLTSNASISGSLHNNTSYQTQTTAISGVALQLNNSEPIAKDDSYDIWVSQYPNYTNQWSGTMTIYWGEQTNTCSPTEANNTMSALQVVVLSGSVNNPILSRYSLDPCIQRSLTNRFEFVPLLGGQVDNKTYAYRKTFTINSGIFIRIIPLYASANIAVKGCDVAGNNCKTLPPQGTIVESVGVADNTKRKIISYRRYPKLPIELFPYSFFSPQ